MHFSLLSLSALLSVSSAHLIMVSPPSWQGVPASSPLEPDGSNFPCQGAIPDVTPKITLKANSMCGLKLEGSAAHGGGSGQITYTLDFPPTKNSIWYVGYSWEGNHPFKVPGNYPADPTMPHDPISFFVPPQLPSGRIVFAWNWFNKIGNREHYMKCATVNIQSTHTDRNQIKKLPTAFRANSGNGCIVPENTEAIKFKNPGKYLSISPGVTPVPVACDSSKPGSSSVSSRPIVPAKTQHKPAPKPKTNNGYQSSATHNSYSQTTASPQQSYQSHASAQASASAGTGGPQCVEGTVTCNPDGSWSQCGSGINQRQGMVPIGTKCVNGIFSAAKVKRDVRFSQLQKRGARFL